MSVLNGSSDKEIMIVPTAVIYIQMEKSADLKSDTRNPASLAPPSLLCQRPTGGAPSLKQPFCAVPR